jgi:formamidopyrimidine-DNA glycosylase
MPELPEVETICRSLKPHILHKQIGGVSVFWPAALAAPPGVKVPDILLGRDVESVTRRGKYLLLALSQGLSLVIHLRMTGQLVFHAAERGRAEMAKHTHVIFYFKGGELHFTDTRKFGRIQIIDTLDINSQITAKLGPEPLDETFACDVLRARLASRHKTAAIKSALLNQEVVAGLGNIYADEVLFAAGVRPTRSVKNLKPAEIMLIHQAIRDILTASIAVHGTTFRDYCDGEGQAGDFQKNLKVYGRRGKPCVVCATALENERISGRSSVFCPACQT